MWGQNIIQEAFLVVMAGTPPPWTMSLPCSGDFFRCFPSSTDEKILQECHHEKDCFLAHAAAYVNATTAHSLAGFTPSLNGCFNFMKKEYAPNSRKAWGYYSEALKADSKPNCDPNKDLMCCHGLGSYVLPGCTGGPGENATNATSANTGGRLAHWGASGAGVVLLPEKDLYVNFNTMKLRTLLLWHHGHARLFQSGCE
jgi:hypothetical protein